MKKAVSVEEKERSIQDGQTVALGDMVVLGTKEALEHYSESWRGRI